MNHYEWLKQQPEFTSSAVCRKLELLYQPFDQHLYARIRAGQWYPGTEDLKLRHPEPPQITLFRELYDYAAYMVADKRQPFLATLNMLRPYLSEEWEPEGS